MKKNIKRTAVAAAGVLFVFLGLIGLALPFLQGIFFIVIGLILLSISSTRIRMWVESHTRRFPKIHAGVERLERWVTGIIGPVD